MAWKAITYHGDLDELMSFAMETLRPLIKKFEASACGKLVVAAREGAHPERVGCWLTNIPRGHGIEDALRSLYS